ncbi:MAG: Trm112 family protein, partial [Candidatus Poribacteria bacterium]
GEKLYGWDYHKWIFRLSNYGKLIIKKKTKDSQFGQLFHYLYKNDKDYAKFHTKHHELFLIQFEWFGTINYEIIESDDDLINLNNMDEIKNLLAKRSYPKVSELIKRALPSNVRKLAKKTIVKSHSRSRRTLNDIKNIIVCPVCKNQLQWQDDQILCSTCNRKYPIHNGIPFLLR